MPKGLVYALGSYDSWLYGGDPLDSLCVEKLYADLRARLDSDYYEQLLKELILDSKHCAKVLLRPSNTLGEEKAQKEKEKLAAIAAKWSSEERKKLVELNQQLAYWQSLEDTPEQKATLPALHIEDLKKTITPHEYKLEDYEGKKLIIHEDDTDGISYVSLYVSANDLSLEECTVLGQLLSYLGQVRTENYDVLTLNREMRRVMGDFDAAFTPAYTYKDQRQVSRVNLSFSSLQRYDKEAVELFKEIIYRSDFCDKQAIRDILKQNIFTMEQTFISSGSLAALRSAAYSSPLAAANDHIVGLQAYRYLKDLDDHYEEKADAFIELLKKLQQKVFCGERYTLSLTAADKELFVKSLLADAPHGTVGEEVVKQPLGHRKEGIAVPANISYAAKSLFMPEEAINSGAMYVIANILSYDYLWNMIRVKGGAYGCGYRCGLGKTATFYSFRDPDPHNSLNVYTKTVDYLKDFVENNTDIENYIVGTTGEFDPYMTLKSKIRAGDNEYLLDMSAADRQKVLDQILNTSLEDIREAISLFEKINEHDDVCVIGNAQALKACGKQLDEIFDLNEQSEA